jgi:hypothetical protein
VGLHEGHRLLHRVGDLLLLRRDDLAAQATLLLQPTLAIVFGVRGGRVEARAGNPPYLFGLLFAGGRRRELLRSGLAAIRNLLAAGIIMDQVFQLVLYRPVSPVRRSWSDRS